MFFALGTLVLNLESIQWEQKVSSLSVKKYLIAVLYY